LICNLQGYRRQDGRIGIRNHAIVVYLGEAMRQIARNMTRPLREQGAESIGFLSTRPDRYASKILRRLATHSNVGAALVLEISPSEEGDELKRCIESSGRRAAHLDCCAGGARAASIGGAWLSETLEELKASPRETFAISDLVIGTICGGSDSTSALSANPGIGVAYDRLIAEGATAIFEETGELIGCDHLMAARAKTPEAAKAILAAMAKAVRHFSELGHGSFAPGNAEGGLTTIEEKSLGAYAKSGSAPISGVIRPGDIPPGPGLYLMDKIPDGPLRYGFSDATDNVGVAEMIACGAQLILFSTGRGSVVGSAISPVIKVCANPETYRQLSEDMDVDAGRVLEGRGSLPSLGDEIYDLVLSVAAGEQPASERLGHQEFILTHKAFAGSRERVRHAIPG
jgi:altronate dehydratase large subunit